MHTLFLYIKYLLIKQKNKKIDLIKQYKCIVLYIIDV